MSDLSGSGERVNPYLIVVVILVVRHLPYPVILVSLLTTNGSDRSVHLTDHTDHTDRHGSAKSVQVSSQHINRLPLRSVAQ